MTRFLPSFDSRPSTPAPPSPPSIRTDIFPSRVSPRKAASTPHAPSRSSPSAPWLRVPFDEADPFAPATTQLVRPRSARASYSPSLPDGAHQLLLSAPPAHVRTRQNSGSLRVRPSSDTLRSDAGEDSFMQKGLAALGFRTLGRKASSVSIRPLPFEASLPRVKTPPALVRRPSRVDVRTFPPIKRPQKAKLSSKSPKEDLPETWDEFTACYAQGEIDIEDPPFPPLLSGSSEDFSEFSSHLSSPFAEQNYPAPKPPHEHSRNRLLARLDLLGRNTENEGVEFDTPSSPASSDDSVIMRDPPRGPRSPPMSRGTGHTSQSSTSTSASASTVNSLAFSISSYSTAATSPSLGPCPPSRSLKNDPSLLRIVARCRELFRTKIVVISLLQNEQVVFLASKGMPDDVEALPRSATFCAHTVLNGTDGFVVLDTYEDWRFRNNILSVILASRFYAGVPIFLPNSVGGKDGEPLAIGTLSIIDDKPKASFSSSKRAQLRDLASEASSEIEAWLSERGRVSSDSSRSTRPVIPPRQSSLLFDYGPPKETTLEARYRDWQASLRPMTPPTSLHRPSDASFASLSSSQRPLSPPLSIRRASEDSILCGSRNSTLRLDSPFQLSPMAEEPARCASLAPPATSAVRTPPPSHSLLALPSSPASSSSHSSHTTRAPSTKSARRRVQVSHRRPAMPDFDPPRDGPSLDEILSLATRTLATALDLDLAYVVELDLARVAPSITLLSSHSRHTSYIPPSFDESLHLKALRSREGGLLYQNPKTRRHLPTLPLPLRKTEYASGMLIPILETAGRAFVLAGYSKETGREFDWSDLDAYSKVARELSRVLLKMYL